MRRALWRATWTLCLWTVALQGAGAAIQVTDDTGRVVALPRPAERVVSLAPHITELVFAVGAGDRLVGTVRFADHPPAAREIPRLGDAFMLNFEALVALQPDLVLLWHSGTPLRFQARLEALGVALYRSEPTDLRGIADAMRSVSQLLGTQLHAEAAAAEFLQRLEALRQPEDAGDGVDVFIQISAQPRYTVNNRHLIGQALRWCGGRNVFGNTKNSVFPVSAAAVVALDPGVIVLMAAGELEFNRMRADWTRFEGLRAVRTQRLYPASADLLSRPAPRIVEGIAELCDRLEQARR